MAIKYSDEQLLIIKGLMDLCGKFADQILHIMQNHGLDKELGAYVKIEVDPSLKFVTKMLEFGKGINLNSGYIKLTRGMEEDHYAATGKNSHEYEVLFAPPEVAERIREVLKRTGTVSASDLLGNTDCHHVYLDCGV